MLDIKTVRETPEQIRTSIHERRMDPNKANLDLLIEIDQKWREGQGRLDTIRGERNHLSTTIKDADAKTRPALVEKVKALKETMSTLEQEVERLKEDRDRLLRAMPNLLGDNVPRGKTDDDNVEISQWGEQPSFAFTPRDHVTLGELTDTIDFARGAKVSGNNFYFLKNEAVLLEQALCLFAGYTLRNAGFVPIITPDLARHEILDGIGFSPRGAEKQVYNIEETELSLVGTAEITIGGYHSGEIFDASALPLKYVGFSHCFRTEAGAYGKESRGLYRVHQFTKAEMFILCAPDQSPTHHEALRQHEEALLKALNIPYRVVNVCAGELGAPAAKKYDIEAWMPGRNAYGEVTSCSNCTDYQARRLNIRFRPEPNASPHYIHLLNGTAIAVSRTLIAIYENYQAADGSITIPEVLRPWMGGIEKIPARVKGE